MRDNARRLVFIKHSAHAPRIIRAAMHREKLEVQGYVKDNSLKQCKKKVALNRLEIISLYYEKLSPF